MLSNSFIERLLLLIIGSYITYCVSMEIIAQTNQLEMDSTYISPQYQHLKLNSYEKIHLSNIKQVSENSVNFDSIIGHSELKKTINECILKQINNKSVNHCELLDPPNGIILHGPPGTGKTMFAKAIAKGISCPFIVFSIHTVENKMFGESAKILKGLFTLANKIKPCVIFIDELDGFFGHRTANDQSFVTGLKTQMLHHLDGIEGRSNDVIVIGATNMIENIDKAVRRRLRMHLLVDLPDIDTRKSMFEKYLHEFKDINYEELGKLSNGLSGSDIYEVCKAAAHKAVIETSDYRNLNQEMVASTIQHFCKT